MAIKILIFLAVILTLTVGANLLFYKAVIGAFVITNPTFKISLLTILVILALSFMASFFMLQWQENPLTIGFYKLSAVWIGLFLYLLPAMLVGWIIIAVIRLAGSSPPAGWIAVACIVGAVLYSAYGIWNAYHTRIQKFTVRIENLPDQWKHKTIVQLSDVHLGHFYGTELLIFNKEMGVDLQLSGHSHAGQMFPFGFLTKLIYKGYDYGFHRLSRFAIYTTSGVGTWGPPMRTGNAPEIVAIDLK